ncbi:unnamed protein product [Lepidochelys kempii]
MKTAGVFMVLPLVLLCCFSGIASEPLNQLQNDCSAYPEAKGQTFLCTTEYHPVCGTNGVTYNNICFCAPENGKLEANLTYCIREYVRKRLIAVDTHEQKTHARYPAHESMHQSVELMVSLIAMNVCCVQKSLNGATIGLAHKGKYKEKWITGVNIGIKHEGVCNRKDQLMEELA